MGLSRVERYKMLLNKENFWHEVRLLAMNNFGNWTTREEARERVDLALEAAYEAIKHELGGLELNNIVDDMMEGLEETITK